MIHHDYENAGFWGAPSLQLGTQKITFVIDISKSVRILTDLLADCINDGQYCEELRSQVIKHTCNCLLAFLQQEKTLLGSYDENTNKAIQCLLDYQIPEVVACRIFHETENSIIKSLMNIIPDIDDERKYKIVNHKIIDKEDLYLTLETVND